MANRNIIEATQVAYEQGVTLRRSYFDSDEEYNEYLQIEESGPQAFYNEFKDDLDSWDPNFWDEYGMEKPDLPVKVTITTVDCDISNDDEVCDYIANYLSDEYGYTVCCFFYEVRDGALNVSEIEWDF